MDERVKHRVVGLAVIVSIGAIIAPAVIKKSSQHFDERTTTTFHMPKRPVYPKVTVADDKEVFKSVKVAHVELDKIKPLKKSAVNITKAKPIATISPQAKVSKKAALSKPIQHKKVTVSKRFSVQLASFTQQENADALINALSRKGYHAHFEKIKRKSGRVIYKVVVGDEAKRENAQKLQRQLVKRTKLNGIVISHSVS